jgi:endonuclease G
MTSVRANIVAAVTGATFAMGAVLAAPHVQSRIAPARPPRIELLYGTPTPHFTERAGYVFAFDPGRKCAAWTLHYLDNQRVSARAQRASFRADESLPAECRASLRDYEGTALHDRGHLVPAADCDWSTRAAQDAGLLSNVAPQSSALNRGQWAKLEQHLRDIATRPNTEVWIVTGTFNAPHQLPRPGKPTDLACIVEFLGGSHIPVATHWYKAAFVRCDEAIELLAWAAPNGPWEVESIDEWRVATDVVESWAGVDLWAALPDHTEKQLEARGR